MIDKRLMRLFPGSMRFIRANVAVKWLSLAANIVLIFTVCGLFETIVNGTITAADTALCIVVIAAAVLVRAICTKQGVRLSFCASKDVKKNLRQQIYEKLLRLGSGYDKDVATAEAVQLGVEGVEQLETYFGGYLPQFYYCMLAPVTLFIALAFVSVKAAVVLLVCVPLIPISIMVVMKIAKRIFSKYWGSYTSMGDTFLENVQGLTTLKIYQADGEKHEEMNRQAENFRKSTMKVLVMQLNSIIVMDICAYGGAAAGMLVALHEFSAGSVSFSGCLAITLLAADFFLPMRALGSLFHVAMNGIAASGKIFRLLDLPEPEKKTETIDPDNCAISCDKLSFSYEENREILHDVSVRFPAGSFTAIVGESGCGKSTLAGILTGRNAGYGGEVMIGGVPLSAIAEESLNKNLTLVAHDSYIFRGTVRENLLYGDPSATDEEMWAALEKTKLALFLQTQDGLDTQITENAANFSGGQRQRLAIARALLHDTPVCIFDEATSNIDVQAEADLVALIHRIAKERTVILISHRLANAVDADNIYVMDAGRVVGAGTHEALLASKGLYARLWENQQALEQYGKTGQTGGAQG